MRFGVNGATVESNVIDFNPVVTQSPDTPKVPLREHTPGMVISKSESDLKFARDKEKVEQPVYEGNVSDFFGSRKAIWYGQGDRIDDCMSVDEVFAKVPRLASPINKEPIFDQNGRQIPNYFATIRECDRRSMGVVKSNYHVVQNPDAFGMLDDLVGEGVRLENVGTWANESRVWVLGKLPKDYTFDGDKVEPHILLVNSFDGSGSLKIALVVNRIICQNQIAINLKNAKRSWSARHTRTIEGRMDEARESLGLSEIYMQKLQEEYDRLSTIKINADKVIEYSNILSPHIEGGSERQNRNASQLRESILRVYLEAPDLKDRDQNATRFLQAVADVEDHRIPARRTANFASNRFEKIANGERNTLLNRAYDIVLAA